MSSHSRATTCVRRVVLSCILVSMAAAGAVQAQEKIETFRLETMDRGRTYGPFELGSGRRIFIGGEAYILRLTTDKKINFECRDGRVYGPFDFVAGRIVELILELKSK